MHVHTLSVSSCGGPQRVADSYPEHRITGSWEQPSMSVQIAPDSGHAHNSIPYFTNPNMTSLAAEGRDGNRCEQAGEEQPPPHVEPSMPQACS